MRVLELALLMVPILQYHFLIALHLDIANIFLSIYRISHLQWLHLRIQHSTVSQQNCRDLNVQSAVAQMLNRHMDSKHRIVILKNMILLLTPETSKLKLLRSCLIISSK